MLTRLIPFVFLGIMIVMFVVGLIVFSYLLIAGAVVGVLLFAVAWVKEKLFPTKHISIDRHILKRGRTFEHDDE